MSEAKFCMGCDCQELVPIDRRCILCKFLVCEDCMPEGMRTCLFCMDTRFRGETVNAV